MSVAVFGSARSKWMSNEAVRVCSLLKEAQPLGKRFAELGSGEQWHAHDDAGDEEKLARGRLLSRYGVWMLVELCPPNDNADVDVLGRLISMLFQVHSFKPRPTSVNHFYNQTYFVLQWFDATAYLPDSSVGAALERLKPQYISDWLMQVAATHQEVILSCLLPHPKEYARVGGHWFVTAFL